MLPLAALALLVAASACASGPRRVELLAEGGAGLNPTFDGKPSAVNVRLFALLDRAAFDNASEQDLEQSPPQLTPTAWKPPHQEAVVYVGQKSWIELELAPEVRFVGVFGLFNEFTGDHKLVVPVEQAADEKLVLDGSAIKLAPRGEGDRR